MATLRNRTDWSFAKSGTTTSWTVTIPAAAAGSTLVLQASGGAQVAARITSSSGASFTQRTQALGTLAVSVSDITASGGETAVVLTLSGAENVAGTIYELAGLGAFIAASNNGTGAQAVTATDFQSRPSSAVTVATGSAVLVGAWAVPATAAANPFSGINCWRQMGPLGKLYVNSALQPGANTQFCYASGLADVTSAGSYPAQLSAGQYEAASVWVQGGSSSTFAAQAAYADASGVATNPAPVNAIVAENSLPGTVQTNWFLGSAGTDPTIAGFCDKTSYAPGDTVSFKVDSTGNPWRAEIYRLGYYGWETFGARNVTGNQGGYITGSVVTQPAASVDGALGSASCAAWTANATWTIPAGAAPGVYFVLFRRTDITTHVAAGHFIVRSASAAGRAAIVIPDYTYQAYNVWGSTSDNGTLGGTWTGRSLYQAGADGGTPSLLHRAYAVSFDRPYSTSTTQANTYLFDAEQGLVAFAEAQGYNLTYYSSRDLDDNTALLNTASLVMLLGHHEYWSANVYDCITNAVAAGVNLFITSSNTALWHVRFGAGDAGKRTMICYKDSSTVDVGAGWTGTGRDPGGYTGTWRDSRTASAPNNPDVRRENALTGQLFVASAHQAVALTVPFAQKGLPCWRNSPAVQALTTGTSYTTPTGVGGDELDSPDGSSGQPANLVELCPTPATGVGAGSNAQGTIYAGTISPLLSFTLHRAASGALVFNSGAWRGWQGVTRWAQDRIGSAVTTSDVNWQNALLAVLYDLGLTPAAAREMRPATDTAVTDPATGAPGGGRSRAAIAYGLRAPRDGGAFLGFPL